MKSEDLKDYAREGLKHLLNKSKDFKVALEGIRSKYNIDLKSGKEPFMGDKPRVADETPQVQRRIRIHAKAYLKNDDKNEFTPLVNDVKKIQKRFFLENCPFHSLISLVVLGNFAIEPSSYKMQMNLTNMTLELVIKPHISKKEFNFIWKEVKSLKKQAKKANVKSQSGVKDFELAFIFYEERQKNPKASRKEIAQIVAKRISKGGRLRQFDNTEVSRNVKRIKDFIKGLGLIYQTKGVTN